MKLLPWDIYIIILILFNGLIIVTPFLYIHTQNQIFYDIFIPFCHQKIQRSICVYENSISDCYNQNIEYLYLTKNIMVENEKGIGYKFPVCSRDLSLFLSMLIGGIAVYFYKGKKYSKLLPIWFFILILIPIGIDGGTQLIGLRQSTNFFRIITGFIAGFGISFFIIPLINKIGKNETNKKISVKRK